MRILITGGARSGKSAYAQNLIGDYVATNSDTRAVIVVFGKQGVDEEFDQRIAKHKEVRPVGWSTLELGGLDYTEWPSALGELACAQSSVFALDCVGTMVATIIDSVAPSLLGDDWFTQETIPNDASEHIELIVFKTVDMLLESMNPGVLVTNEVGAGVVPATPNGRLFVDIMGRLNRHLSEQCDKAYLCVMGKCIDLQNVSEIPDWE